MIYIPVKNNNGTYTSFPQHPHLTLQTHPRIGEFIVFTPLQLNGVNQNTIHEIIQIVYENDSDKVYLILS
jgi:hypothetical protein